MYLIEQQALIYIIKELPRMGISYDKIEKECPYVTIKTLHNYRNGITKPKGKKFSYLISALKSKYPTEYEAARAKFEMEEGNTLQQMTIDEIKQSLKLGI